MNTAKKWMVSLTDGQHEWVKQTASDASIDGSSVIREAIEQAIKDSKGFISHLIGAQVRMKLDVLQEKKATLEEEIRALQAKTQRSNGVKVPA